MIGKPKRVLFLEDDPQLARGYRRLFAKRLSGGVAVAASVDEALAMLEMIDFAAVVSDVNVEGERTGLDFYRIVQRLHPGLASRFIFCSGADVEYPPGVPVVRKHHGPDELYAAIRDVIYPPTSQVEGNP